MTTQKMQNAFQAIESQLARFSNPRPGQLASPAMSALAMDEQLRKIKKALTHGGDDAVTVEMLDSFRRVAALATRVLADHGAPLPTGHAKPVSFGTLAITKNTGTAAEILPPVEPKPITYETHADYGDVSEPNKTYGWPSVRLPRGVRQGIRP